MDKIADGPKHAGPAMQTAENTPRMKMPLKYGIPLLIALWLASGFIEYGQGKTLLMALAMGVALWTAFSLPRPRRRKPEELQEDAAWEPSPPPADGDTAESADESTAKPAGESTTPSNGSGRPLSRSGKHTKLES